MVRTGAGEPTHYDQLEVSELFCPRCRAARAVRQHLLLVLPDGNRYEYRCGVCGASVGEKADDDRSEFESILRAT
ncbi:MAG TPA: cytoplasmic protein [Thermoanaerobaculia bacterium]|nr:cytoplasmic protein [Thermoanaerobaculia bacterium]